MNTARRSLFTLMTLLGVLSSSAGAGGQDSGATSPVPATAAYPTIMLPGGTPVSLGALKNRPRILHFFSGTCVSCQEDDRLLRDSAFDYADQGVVLINVFRTDAFRSRSVDAETLIPGVPATTDRNGRLAAIYQVHDRAETVFLNRQGHVVARLPAGLSQVTVLRFLQKTLAN
ncbi:TlpA family protein disulfide reductase [Deinococcus sp. UYEF24]